MLFVQSNKFQSQSSRVVQSFAEPPFIILRLARSGVRVKRELEDSVRADAAMAIATAIGSRHVIDALLLSDLGAATASVHDGHAA
jgi:hypothetical protein